MGFGRHRERSVVIQRDKKSIWPEALLDKGAWATIHA